MKKLMRPQDRILFLLASVGDIFVFLHEEVGIGKMSLRELYGWVPKKNKRKNFKEAVRRMLKTGYVEKILKDGEPYLRLTSGGRDLIKRDFPLLELQRERWDGKWRLVIFDIREKKRWKRNFFREKIKELGLGMIQKSVYLTPFDICRDLYEFAEESGLKEAVFVMEVTNLLIGDAKFLAEKVWGLEELNEEYQKILEEAEEVENLKGRQQEKKLKELKDEYFQTLIKDPLLPKDLLPSDWLREKAGMVLANLEV